MLGINIALYYTRTYETLQGIKYSPLLYQNATKRYEVLTYLYYIRTLQNGTRYEYTPLLYWNATKRYKVLI